jgi:hydroxymethylpyrimidine/phosphomethylpyrimidine kinase
LIPVALTIAGSDPSGGAGIQADLKTFHRHGVYGEAVVTLITVQNTRTVSRVEVLDPALVVEQIRAVLSDIPPGAAKTGALGDVRIVEAIAKQAAGWSFPLIVDPVMISKHGAPLIEEDARAAVRDLLIAHATLVTPNLPEAAALTGLEVNDIAGMRAAAERLCSMGCNAALVKGGHLPGDAVDVLLAGGEYFELRSPRVNTRHTHGTGCTYSAAIAAELARGTALVSAVRAAKEYVTRAIGSSPGLGSGSGPVNHFA